MSFWSWIWPINHLNTLTPSSLVLIRTTLEQSSKLCTNYGKHSPMDLVIKDLFSTLSIISLFTPVSRSVNDNVTWGNNHRPLRCKCQCQPDLGCAACARSTRRNSHWTQAASSERRAPPQISHLVRQRKGQPHSLNGLLVTFCAGSQRCCYVVRRRN